MPHNKARFENRQKIREHESVEVMNDYERKVAEFHKAFGQEEAEPLTVALLELRKKLIEEEVRELFDEMDGAIAAIGAGSAIPRPVMLNMLKEMADVQYVLSGMAVTFGFPMQEVFTRVHASNMSKLGVDGKPLKREDGKVLKGPHYHPPLLDDVIP